MSKPARVIPLFGHEAYWRRSNEQIADAFWSLAVQAFARRFPELLAGLNPAEVDGLFRLRLLSGEVLTVAQAREEKVLRAYALGDPSRAGAMIREVWGPRGRAVIEAALADEATTRRRWQAKLSKKAVAARAEDDGNTLRVAD